MQKAEPRLLNGGINADSLPKEGEVLNLVNMRGLPDDAASGGVVSTILGNVPSAHFNAQLPGGDKTLLGKCVCQTSGLAYFFFHDSDDNHVIIRYNAAADTASVIFGNDYVTGGLNWHQDMFISADADEHFLLFTDNVNDIRYLNLGVTYSSGSPISQGQLSYITEPGAVPLTPTRVNLISQTDLSAQRGFYQFTYRFTNQAGFTSVLSPYSATIYPVRKSAIASLSYAGNVIDVVLPTSQAIPNDWKTVEFVVCYPDTGKYFVINRWDAANTTDAAAVALHNSLSSPLTLSGWHGQVNEAIDDTTAGKPFDNVPLTAKSLKRSANRALLGNTLEGYDTPVVKPTVTVGTTAYSPASLTTNSYTPYIIIIEWKGTRNWYFAIIIRFGGKNYLLPRDCAAGSFYYDNDKLDIALSATKVFSGTSGVFNLPTYISKESLIELKETADPNTTTVLPATGADQTTRVNIVVEANNLSGFVAEDLGGNENWYLFVWNNLAGSPATVTVENTPPEFGAGSQSRAFLDGGTYSYGIQYLDGPLRKCGNLTLGNFIIPAYDISSPAFVEKKTFTVPSGVVAAIPDWASYFCITLSRALRAQRFGFFFGGIVKALFGTGDGSIVYGDPSELLSPPAGRTIYGIGVPIPTTFKYDYIEGDYMLYSSQFTSSFGRILGTYSGHFVLQFTNDGQMHKICAGFSKRMSITEHGSVSVPISANLTDSTRVQDKVAFTVVSGINADTNQYEVAAFGNITGTAGAKQFGSFFSSTTKTVDIYGDCCTQIRTSNSGGGLGIGMTTNEDSTSLFWITDLGRISPLDHVGQKRLSNVIRFSNTAIPGADINGLASFDAGDYKTTDASAGEITALALSSRGKQDGGQLLALCERDTYVGLVGQQKLRAADGGSITISGVVLDDFSPITGGWGCTSPRSIEEWEGSVWWQDAFTGDYVEFNASGAQCVSRHGVARVFRQILANGATLGMDVAAISSCVNPYTQEVMVSFPPVSFKSVLGSTTLPVPDDAYYPDGYTYAYHWPSNKWSMVYAYSGEMLHVGNIVLRWTGTGLMKEFTGGSTIDGVAIQSIVAIPFRDAYPATVTPSSIQIDATVQPSEAWLISRDTNDALQVATIGQWKHRKGTYQGEVFRDRLHPLANSGTWDAYGINGDKIKSRYPIVIFVWTTPATIKSALLNVSPVSGQLK